MRERVDGVSLIPPHEDRFTRSRKAAAGLLELKKVIEIRLDQLPTAVVDRTQFDKSEETRCNVVYVDEWLLIPRIIANLARLRKVRFQPVPHTGAQLVLGVARKDRAVSYTHLTLPTKRIV